MSIENLAEAEDFLKEMFPIVPEWKIRAVVFGLMAKKPLQPYWQGGIVGKSTAYKAKRLFDDGKLKEYVQFLSATSEIEIEQQAVQLLASANQKPLDPIQQEAWEQCRVGNHEWMKDYKYKGQAFKEKFWFETNGNSMMGRTELTCWFCGQVTMR